MARIRSIKPEFWGDFDTAEHLSRDARLLYIALWNFADEHARLPGDRRYVKGHCFPYDDDLTPDAIDALIDELAAVGNVVRYTVDNAPYLHLPHLAKHQRLEAAKVPSRLPPPPDPGSGMDSSERGADESARDAEPSETSVVQHVAGGREHAAGSMPAEPGPKTPQQQRSVDNLPGELLILRSALDARKLSVRWDTLTADQIEEIRGFVTEHGDARLVQEALKAFRPDNPAVYAQAWLDTWRDIRPLGHLAVVPSRPCPERGHSGTVAHCAQCASERLAGDA